MNSLKEGTQKEVSACKFGFIALGVSIVIVLLIVLIGPPDQDEGVYLDPKSPGPYGTKALVLLLEELGAQVDVVRDLPLVGYDVALVLEDYLGDEELDAMDSWVNEGGTLVVADPYSPLIPFDYVFNPEPDAIAVNDCHIPALKGIKALSGTYQLLQEDGVAQACFGDGTSGQVVIGPKGNGTLVALANPELLVNENIGNEDNAVLAGALLSPKPGMKLAIVAGSANFGGGPDTIYELMGDRSFQGIYQLVIGFLIYALWRARRLGKPVCEDLPVELSASDLVRSTGNLLRKAQCREQVGQLLKSDLRRRLVRRLNLGAGLAAENVAEIASARTGIPIEKFKSALLPSPIDTDGDLVALGVAIEKIDQEVGHV